MGAGMVALGLREDLLGPLTQAAAAAAGAQILLRVGVEVQDA
jgi:hypothetical protein